MALQSEVSPPLVGDANKDTKIDGDTKSDDNESSQSTDEDVDLEEGEILDSGGEEEKKDFTNSSLKEALDKNCLQSIEQLVCQAKNSENASSPNRAKTTPPPKRNKRAAKYLDHDHIENTSEQEDGWFPPAPKYKSKLEDKPIDYRMELAAYRGTPPSSPERKRRDEKTRRKRSSKKSKKTGRKTINRKDIKGQRVRKYTKDIVKSRICKFFKEGKCAKGADCLYSHASPQPYKKKELCKFYLNDHCNKGRDCIYMHNEFPCKFYHTGSECYAKEDCRFSHVPLTDEMKKVLADYLKAHHGDDDHESRKRHISRSPERKGPPPKRMCLLGSPPRHIREAEETKRWQEEMKMLQHQNHPGFEIQLNNTDENESPPQFSRPNFYQETLPHSPSPQKQRTMPETSNPLPPPPSFPPTAVFPQNNSVERFDKSPSRGFSYNEEFSEVGMAVVKQEPPEEFGWKNAHNIAHSAKENSMKQFVEPVHQELDFTSDVKFDETTQFSEMESSTDYPPILSPGPATRSTATENNEGESEDISNQEFKSGEEKASDDNSQEPPAPPIVIPSHLPRKQRELFMRIQQHQRRNSLTTVAKDLSNSPGASENTELQVKKEESEEEEQQESETKDSKWYSSEDDDDDTDQPLTDVLKKLRQAPPPKTQIPEAKPAVNLMAMLNKIQQNTLERSKATTDTQQQQGKFWENLFLGSATTSEAKVSSSNVVATAPKRRTLLPDPLPLPTVKKEPAVPKDPRLKNRDPRTLAVATNITASVPKTSAVEKNNLQMNSSPVQDTPKTGANFPKTATPLVNEPVKENVPYRLHGIYTKPPNYIPYIHASQSNPKLLNDPRLRKHLNLTQGSENVIENGKDPVVIKPSPPTDIPPIPKLLLKYEKPESLINIFETSSSTKQSDENASHSKPPPPIVARRVSDPRCKRRDSRSNSGSDTPPQLTIVETCTTPPLQEFKTAPILENALMEPVAEKKGLPPVLEKNWTPPVLEKAEKNWTVCIKKEVDSDSESTYDPPRLEINEKSIQKTPPHQIENITLKILEPSLEIEKCLPPVVPPLIIKKMKPTPASHLPRAIADPRMAKLHHPLDPRRTRVATDSTSKSIVERKKPAQIVIETPKIVEDKTDLKSSEIVSEASSQESVTEFVAEESSKPIKSIPKKRRLSDKSEEKKKTVHRNRKTSMDYASPLNSCDSTESSKSLSYNSYNQRPKPRTVTLTDEKDPLTIGVSNPDINETPSVPDYLNSDNSNLECDNSNDVNLKDMFKTIDPTASPFC